MIRIKLFDGEEKHLEVFNQQAIQNLQLEFFVDTDCDAEQDTDEDDYSFPGYLSSYLRVFNERLGTEIKDIALSRSGGSLIVNASVADMTFDPGGNYWYEIGYNNGYDIVLSYGILKVK